MNPWEWVSTILGWFFLALMVLGALIILFAVLVAAARGARKWFAPKPSPTSRDQFVRERDAIALNMVRDDHMPINRMDAFKAGAEWSRGFHTRKK